jgi:hypothetical protein
MTSRLESVVVPTIVGFGLPHTSTSLSHTSGFVLEAFVQVIHPLLERLGKHGGSLQRQ